MIRKKNIRQKLQVLWKYGLFSWIPLKDLKYSNPFKVVECTKNMVLDGESDFAQWKPHILMRIEAIIATATVRARNISHKYGIETPVSVDYPHEIGRNNSNKFCGR